MMRFSRYFVTLLLLLAGNLMASPGYGTDFATVDRTMARCYTEQKWDSVILVGKEALRNNIDYYYLRVRLGISYFELQRYYPAAVHLEKALDFNSADAMVAGYLYLAYRNTNREPEARVVKASIPQEDWALPGHLITNPRFLHSLHAEGGYTLSSDRNPDNLATLMGPDSIYGQQDLYGNNSYANVGLTVTPARRLDLTLSYNYLNFDKKTYIQYGRTEANRDTIIENPYSRDYFYSFPWTIHDTTIIYKMKQNEVYLAAAITLPWGLKIAPALHWLHVGYQTLATSYKIVEASDTAYYSYIDSTWHLFTYPTVNYTFQTANTTLNNYVISLQLSKSLGIFDLSLSGSWSNLNGKKQKQAGLVVTYYPLGNLTLYGTTGATALFENKNNRFLFSQIIGGRLASWLWAEGSIYYGDYTNSNLFNGAIVYNISDMINYRLGGTLTFPIGKHLQLSLNYQYFSKESRQLYYTKTEDPVSGTVSAAKVNTTNPYYTHTIIGGITWKF